MFITVFFLAAVFAFLPGSRALADDRFISELKDSDDYYPADDAVSGGYWETLQSGEQIYCSQDGTPYAGTWVFDREGLYYIDRTGCLMKGNYSEEGFWVQENGFLIQRMSGSGSLWHLWKPESMGLTLAGPSGMKTMMTYGRHTV